MNNIDIKKSYSSFILILIIIVYSASIIFSDQYEIYAGDSTMYLDIAEKYLRGNLTDAVNGYWGPMFSWLLIPLLYFGTSKVFAINVLNVTVGVLTIIGVWILSFRFDISEKIRSTILISLLPIIMFISIVELKDFLLLCFLVYYLAIIFNDTYPGKIYNGLMCGALGSAAYLTKAYALPFFIIHFIFMNYAHFITCLTKREKRTVLRNAITGLVIFSLISGTWIIIISDKYDRFTISTMGKANFSAVGPGLPDTRYELGNPIFHEGFFPPSNKTAYSAWEDPSHIMEKIPEWSPVKSLSNFNHFLLNSLKNIVECIRIFGAFSRLSYVIVIAYILLLIVPFSNRQILRADMLYTFITLLLYTVGYIPFHLELRYLWIVNILLMLMGGYILTILFQSDFFKSNIRQNILLIFFALSFMLTPIKSYIQEGPRNLSKNMYKLSLKLKDKHTIQGNIASNREWKCTAVHDSWHKTFRLAYHLDSKYFGQARKDLSDSELEEEFRKYNIDYYFFWDNDDHIPKFLSRYNEITDGRIPGLNIFALN